METDFAGVPAQTAHDCVNEQQTIFAMKKSISLTSVLPMLVLMLVSCSSGTTTSTTRQTSTTVATTADHRLPSQAAGYRDNNMENFYPIHQ